MKTVLLLGDSIRTGYQETVRRELAGLAQIATSDQNVGTTSNLLVHLHQWIAHAPPDLFHINCGLHDLKTILYGGRENVLPLHHYKENVERILRALRDHSRARVIWATTTPINEKKAHAAHAQVRDFDRYEVDVVDYNQAAVDVAHRLEVPVNDLFSVIMQEGRDKCLGEDGVHFTPQAYELLGKAVAAVIRRHL